ncbi:acyltransferase [Microbacterium trichothecenolyticum]|uniref:acyltransferase family protein n=1 Tax=Microbacterium trichothecenolyticum TaxID=69370 RepID=UPI001C6DE794|nr:acyltransferase [Microbacterium trichothecenolyticum]MBW9122392.1 acyltransferase [Microbacterium trichothecenolyticum]
MTASPPISRSALRLDSLTGVRAIAAFLVFWHHGAEQFEGGISSGMIGVSLFYILSGFVMAWTDRESDTAWLFYRRRFARIYPVYFVAVTVAIAFAVVGGRFEPVDLAAYTLLQSWFPFDEVYFAANAVFWSLSCEVFFYLVFPALRKLTRRLDHMGLWRLGIAAVAVSFAVATVASFFPQSQFLGWAVIVFPPSRLPEFVLGVILGSLMARGWQPRVSLLLAFGLAGVAAVAALVVPYAFSRYAVTLIPFALLVVALASADIDGRRVFTQWGWMVKLGIWSYCFYLVHLMVLNRIEGITVGLGLPPTASVLLALPASVVAAWLLHILVERPGERLLRPKGRRRVDSDEPLPAER